MNQRRTRAPSLRAVLALAVVASVVPVLLSATSAAPAGAAGAVTPGRFVAVTPVRLADTRTGVGAAPPGRVAAGGVAVVAATGRAEVVVPTDATAVVVAVSSVGASAAGYLTVWPSDQPQPFTSNLNIDWPGGIVSNLVTTRLAADGRISVFTTTSTELLVDLHGYYVPVGAATAGRTVAVTPTRAYDSRLTGGVFAPDETRTITLPAAAVPRGASAAVLNLTVTATSGGGYWTVYPPGTPLDGAGRPTTSNLGVTGPGQTLAVQAFVPVAADGTVRVYGFGGGHAIVDVFAYVTGPGAPSSSDGLFVPLPTPVRFADTRTTDANPGLPGVQPPYPGWTVEVPVLGRAGVPPSASLLAATTTFVGATGAGYLSVHAAGTPRPETSSVNAAFPGMTVANHTTMPVGTRGVAVFTSSGGHVLVDVAGFVTGAPQPSSLPPPPNPLPPSGLTSCRAVVHLGDSTSVGLISPTVLPDPADRMDAQYARVGVVDRRLEISGARSIVETLPGQLNAQQVATNVRAAGFHGCWVLALGTTDTANVGAGSGVSRATRIDRMMAVVAGEPVLWINVKTLVTSGAWSNANMQLWNQALEQAKARYPNLRVLDWAGVVQNAWFGSDQVHYTSAGYRARARIIADELAATYPA